VTVEQSKSVAKFPLRFSLRTLLTVMLLVGAFCGGWISHKRWGQVELEEARAEIEKLRRAPRVEYIDGLGLFYTGGRKVDVERLREIVDATGRQTNK
jgi:hypothetical protein